MFASLMLPRVFMPLAMLAIGLFMLVTAWHGPANAMLVPRIVLTIWCLVALLIVTTELAHHAPRPTLTLSPLPLLMAVVLLAAIGVAYLGFLLPSLPLVGLTLWLFRVRKPMPLIIGTVVIGAGLWFLFHHVLLIRLPTLLTGGII